MKENWARRKGEERKRRRNEAIEQKRKRRKKTTLAQELGTAGCTHLSLSFSIAYLEGPLPQRYKVELKNKIEERKHKQPNRREMPILREDPRYAVLCLSALLYLYIHTLLHSFIHTHSYKHIQTNIHAPSSLPSELPLVTCSHHGVPQTKKSNKREKS